MGGPGTLWRRSGCWATLPAKISESDDNNVIKTFMLKGRGAATAPRSWSRRRRSVGRSDLCSGLVFETVPPPRLWGPSLRARVDGRILIRSVKVKLAFLPDISLTRRHTPLTTQAQLKEEWVGFKLCFIFISLETWKLEPEGIPSKYPAMMLHQEPRFRSQITLFYQKLQSLAVYEPRAGCGASKNLALVSYFVPSFAGGVLLVTYYSLLHPKAPDIRQGFGRRPRGIAGADSAEREAPPQEEGSELASVGEPPSLQWGPPGAELESQMAEEDSFFSHHHWLLVKLALKTGDVSKINAVFGEDRPGCFRPLHGGRADLTTGRGRPVSPARAPAITP